MGLIKVIISTGAFLRSTLINVPLQLTSSRKSPPTYVQLAATSAQEGSSRIKDTHEHTSFSATLIAVCETCSQRFHMFSTSACDGSSQARGIFPHTTLSL